MHDLFFTPVSGYSRANIEIGQDCAKLQSNMDCHIFMDDSQGVVFLLLLSSMCTHLR